MGWIHANIIRKYSQINARLYVKVIRHQSASCISSLYLIWCSQKTLVNYCHNPSKWILQALKSANLYLVEFWLIEEPEHPNNRSQGYIIVQVTKTSPYTWHFIKLIVTHPVTLAIPGKYANVSSSNHKIVIPWTQCLPTVRYRRMFFVTMFLFCGTNYLIT